MGKADRIARATFDRFKAKHPEWAVLSNQELRRRQFVEGRAQLKARQAKRGGGKIWDFFRGKKKKKEPTWKKELAWIREYENAHPPDKGAPDAWFADFFKAYRANSNLSPDYWEPKGTRPSTLHRQLSKRAPG